MAGEGKKSRFSPNEQAVLVALLTILALFTAVFGLMVYAGNAGCGAFGPEPCPAVEALGVLSTNVTSPTSVSIQIMNSGSKAVTMTAYYVKDSSGATYANTNWQGPTIQPSGIDTVNISIDGIAFTFQSGYSYSVTVTTARNYLFTFSVQG